MKIEPAVAVIRFELRRRLHDRYTWAGAAALGAVLALGAYFHWQSLPPRPPGGRLFGEGYILGLAIAWHCALALDRLHCFDRFVAANLMSAWSLYVGKLLSSFIFIVSYAVFAFVLALAFSLGEISYAAQYTVRLFSATLLMLPFVVLIELLIGTRMPVPILIIVFFAVLTIYGRGHDVQRLVRLLGLGGTLEAGPVLLRSLVAIAVCVVLYPLFSRRVSRRSLARIGGAPYFGAHGPIDSGSPA